MPIVASTSVETRDWEKWRLEHPYEPHPRKKHTLYHGTTEANAERIRREGFKASNPEAVAHEIEQRYGLPHNSVWNSKYNTFAHGRVEDPNIYLSEDPATARNYAEIGSEVVNDALSAAYIEKFKPFDKEGDYRPGMSGEKRQEWVKEQTAKFYKPTTLTVQVPWETFAAAHDSWKSAPEQPGKGTPEWYHKVMGGTKATTVMIPATMLDSSMVEPPADHAPSRGEMPQLHGYPIPGTEADRMPKDEHGKVNVGPQFEQHLAAKGIRTTHEMVDASTLQHTQHDINQGMVHDMAEALKGGPGFVHPHPTWVSRDGQVLDGHHRQAAHEQAGVPMPIARADIPMSDLLREATEFTKAKGIQTQTVHQSGRRFDQRSWAVFDAMRPKKGRHHKAIAEIHEEARPVAPSDGWKPSMTRAEADAWAKDSVIKGSLWHGTFVTNAGGIKSKGFDTNRGGVQRFGRGAYLSDNRKVSLGYAYDNPQGLLETRVNIKNPASTRETREIIQAVKAKNPPIEALPDAIRDEARSRGFDALASLGYDPKSGASRNYVIFDSRNVTVIKP